MKIKIAVFAAVLLIAGFAGTGAVGWEEVPSKNTRADIQSSREPTQETSALRGLGLALSSGKNAMRPFRGPPSEKHAAKDRLNTPIGRMDCYIDRIASYISCYSSPIDSQEAETLFTSVVDELDAALPSNRWKRIEEEPSASSVRSYIYDDQESHAHIDISIIAWGRRGGQGSYMVSIFGWPH